MRKEEGMGEEEKKAEQVKEAAAGEEEKPKAEKKEEEAKGEGEKKEGGKEEKKAEAAAAPPPQEEIEMRVFMHCEGCARKVKRSLKGFNGVEDVTADCRTHKVVVKGRKAAEDPMKVVQRVQKKTGRKVELLTPLPPAKPEKKEDEKKEEEKAKAEEGKKEEPQAIEVVLKVHMHCDACTQEIKKSILRMKGVEVVEPNLKSSQVTVKGAFDPAKLVEYVCKRTGKHVAVAKQEQVEKKADGEKGGGGKDAAKEEKAENDAGGDNAEKKEEKDGGGGDGASVGDEKDKKEDGGAAEEGAPPLPKEMEQSMRNEFYQCYPAGGFLGYAYPPYPPQIFSDENPNACFVM